MTAEFPGRITPLIRLNSNLQNPFADVPEGHKQPSTPTFRSLTPQELPPGSPASRSTAHGNLSPSTSFDLLLPPSGPSSRRELDSVPSSTARSQFSSRRTSWSGDDVNTHSIAKKYNIVPADGLIVFSEDVEDDDDIHNPNPNDSDRDCDGCNKRGINNVGWLVVMVLGLLALFIAYPVATFMNKTTYLAHTSGCSPGDASCLDLGPRPLLKDIRSGLIDPDTPESARTKISTDGKKMNLVFSDEFNTDGRTFYDGDDAYFQAMDFWYGVTQDLEWYDPDAVTTKNGVLEIRFNSFKNHDLDYRSGMIQSWNKLCFKGGRLEASISLPGKGSIQGFWPGFWTMGNLGRPGYAATTDGMWPYSYSDECDVGITPNQSSTDGINWLPGMRLPACTCPGADHPTPNRSRSSPEIDVIEAKSIPLNNNDSMVIGQVSLKVCRLHHMISGICQIMPPDFVEVYDNRITELNAYRGGPYQQAMSGLSNLNNIWYDGKAYQIYAFEYTPGVTGNITWFIGQDKTWLLDGRAIGPNGNIGQRIIPEEPMSIIVNLGMATNFAPNDPLIETTIPGIMRVDYIRIYQDEGAVSVTCDPEGYETTSYISKHMKAYTNFNLTTWADAGYEWPKNELMHGC